MAGRTGALGEPGRNWPWWRVCGVPQNLTHAVHPDPISGMHCWHQCATVERARDGDECGDVFVDTNRAHEVYREWLKLTRAAHGPGGYKEPVVDESAVEAGAGGVLYVSAAGGDAKASDDWSA